MIRAERVASLGAALSAVGTLACCLPLGIPAALGLIGLSAVLAVLRPWLIAVAVVFLGIGLFSLYRGQRTCQRRSRLSMVLFSVSANGLVPIS